LSICLLVFFLLAPSTETELLYLLLTYFSLHLHGPSALR
jgi:hypothetical protein